MVLLIFGMANAQDQVESVALVGTNPDSTQEEPRRDFRYQLAIHGIYMVPDGAQATDYSRPGFGLGGTFIFPIGSIPDILRAGVGFEFVNLLSKTIDLPSLADGSEVQQATQQNFIRLYGGIHVGGPRSDFFRPYASLNLALHVHGIYTDVVVKDPFDPSIEDRTTTSSTYHAVFGCDMTFGMDLNIWELVSLDGGFRFVKSFAVPQQLGEGSVKIYPHYFQIFVGVRVQGLEIS